MAPTDQSRLARTAHLELGASCDRSAGREARAARPLGMGASLSMSASLCASGKGGGGAGTHALAIKGGGRLVQSSAPKPRKIDRDTMQANWDAIG